MMDIIGVRKGDGLTPPAINILAQAEVIFGTEYNLALVKPHCPTAQYITFIRPFADNIPKIQQYIDKKLVILTTGDPGHYGAGRLMTRHFAGQISTIIPARSIVSLVANALHWAVEDCAITSIHGRETNKFIPFIAPNARIIMLSDGVMRPQNVSQILCERGFPASKITILSNLGGVGENIAQYSARECAQLPTEFSSFHTLAIHVSAENGQFFGRAGVSNDKQFIHDGQISKWEIRAMVMALLRPFAGGVLWDIGAGNGTIALEWARLGGVAHSMEMNPARLDNIQKNAENIGALPVFCHHIQLNGQNLGKLPSQTPDSIFLGGALGDGALWAHCRQILPPFGRLVATAATSEGEQAIINQYKQHGGVIKRVQLEDFQPFAEKYHRYIPRQAVIIYANHE